MGLNKKTVSMKDFKKHYVALDTIAMGLVNPTQDMVWNTSTKVFPSARSRTKIWIQVKKCVGKNFCSTVPDHVLSWIAKSWGCEMENAGIGPG